MYCMHKLAMHSEFGGPLLRSTQTHKYVLEVFINQLWICMNHFLFDISFFLRDCSYNLSFIMYLYG